MLIKYALCEVVKLDTPQESSDQVMIKTASGGTVTIEPGTDKSRIVAAAIKKHPTALFFRAKAIKADEVNSNGDCFSIDELMRSYKTFEGVPFFTNHDNQNIENARGKIIFAEWVDDKEKNEKAVYVIGFVDREAFPHICRSIEEEYVTGVSMGAINGESLIVMADLTEKKISEVNTGDEILSAYGNVKQVKKIHSEYLGKPMYSFDVSTYHKTPMFTNDHPIFMIEKSLIEANKREAIRVCSHSRYEKRMGRTQESIGQDTWRTTDYSDDAKFTEASKIQKGDFVLIPSKFRLEEGSSLNSDFYYVVGAYLGDGYLKKDKNGNYEGISFCLGLNEIELAQKITTILKKYSRSKPHDLVCEERNGLYISLYDRELAKWFSKNIGTGSKTKRLQGNLKFKEDALNLLAGYLDTDGCISHKVNENYTDSYQFSSANIGLLEDIQSLLISLGCVSRIHSFSRIPSKNSIVKVNTIEHTLAVGSNHSSLFKNSIKFNLNNCCHAKIKAGKTFIVNIHGNNFMACPVKEIHIEDFNEPVYDITVEGDECYIAEGVAVHNCSVEYSICSICGNKAEKTDDYCSHIRNRKGRKFTGRAKNVVTGKVHDFKDAPVFEYNYGIKFIELSAVVDPACASCHIEGIIPNEDYLLRVANLQNSIYMFKSAAISKQAGQEEINQLNQVLQTLEEIAIGLIQNRQQVEVEFASDLVEILSNLQKFVDELIGAGYGNIQGAVPGSTDMPEAAPSMAPPTGVTESLPSDVTESAALPTPVSEEVPLGGAGTVAGSPTNPLVKTPEMPITAPIRPKSFNDATMVKMAGALSDMRNKLLRMGDDDMGKRRTLSEKRDQKEKAIKVLSNSWQEKQDFIEYIKQVPSLQDNENKLSVKKRDDSFIIVAENKETDESKVWTYEDLTDEERRLITESPKDAAIELLETFANGLNTQKEGVNRMTDNIKEAGAASVNKAPEVVQEAQLETQGLYHSRTNDEKHEITQAQLESKREGEKEVITEKQLDAKIKLHPRTDEDREVITQAQLEGVRKNDEKQEITQAQLETEGNRVNNEPDVITEKQLDNIDQPWERAAGSGVTYKTASEHMALVVSAMANSVLSTGCTPDEICKVASSMISSSKDRYELTKKITEKSKDPSIDYSSRMSFWSGRNLRIANADCEQISQALMGNLKKVASDETINPDIVVDAIDVITESEQGAESISKSVDEKLASSAKANIKASRKDELRKALSSATKKSDSKENRDAHRDKIIASIDDQKLTREAERAIWEKAIGTNDKACDTIIETSFDEVGCNKDNPSFRTAIKSFAKGALAGQNLRLAAITNVTISGDTIAIAVQTDAGEESVNIPIGDKSQPPPVPEGDLTGEGLEEALPAEGIDEEVYASANSKMKKVAQSPMGGGIPGTPGDVAGGPGAPESGLPGPAPEGDPLQALTTDAPGDEELDVPTAGEKQMPYAICPECGSSDVDVEADGEGDIKGSCNNCGAEYEALVKKDIEFKITKPTKSVGEEGGNVPEELELPALPVAAQTRLDKKVIVRIASNREKYGHVCPACGMNQCKASKDVNGHAEYTCPACGTDVSKDVLIDVNNPDTSYLRVQWDIVPDIEKCASCKDDIQKFTSMIRMEKLMKNAANSPFPRANCVELIARKWGGNAVATFGPCKGKLLADCVCGQLEKLGLTKVRHIERLGSVMTQPDPMDECLNDHQAKGFDIKEATTICNCLKKKFASEDDDKIFTQAFSEDVRSGKEKILTAQDLGVLDDMINEVSDEDVMDNDIVEEDFDFKDGLPPVDEIEIDVEEIEPAEPAEPLDTVTVEISSDAAQELADAAGEALAGSEENSEPTEIEDTDIVEEVTDIESPEVSEEIIEEENEMALASQTNKLKRVGDTVVKVAKSPTKVEDIEGNVEAGVPRSKATIKNESPSNIDVPMAKPSVPRGKATMGQEGPDNIDKPAGLPDVAIDSSYMGVEKGIQKNMPAINDEIKGTVIAEGEGKKITAKQLKEIETVEDNVEAGVPRAKATQGKEGPDNIDVPLNKPDVPRAKATMGQEGPDNIDVKADGPDVPVDNAYMGGEKEVQKDMPAINDEMLKQVKQKRDVQMDRIAQARKMEAVKTASKLLATKRIDEGAYDEVVDALSSFEIDKIASVADKMFPKHVKTASVSSSSEPVYSVPPIVMESKELDVSNPVDEFAKRLSSHFTIGNKSFDDSLTRYGDK